MANFRRSCLALFASLTCDSSGAHAKTQCTEGSTAVVSGEIIQVTEPNGDRGWSIAVSDTPESTCDDDAVVIRFSSGPPPAGCSRHMKAVATGILIKDKDEDDEFYWIADPKDLRCTAYAAEPPPCASGKHAVAGEINHGRLTLNKTGPKLFNITLLKGTQTGECSVGLIALKEPVPECKTGAKIEATGMVQTELFPAMQQVERYTCTPK